MSRVKRIQGADRVDVLRDLNAVGRISKITAVQRLTMRTQTGGADDCWLCSGGANQMGHVLMWIPDYRCAYAHQIAYVVYHGAIPAGMVVRHSCDQPSCCNPKHLVLGTQSDNQQDSVHRGRKYRGGGRKVLTADLVRELRQRHDNGEKIDHLAREVGADRRTVGLAIEGSTWSKVK